MAQAAELAINTSADATQMAETMFGKGVTLVSATYTGDSLSSGIFTGGQTTSPGAVPSDSGIILSTGNVTDFTNDAGEANQDGGTTTDTTGPVNTPQLDEIAGVPTFDGAILEATFIPEGSVLTMQLVFSSEEYPEFVNGGYNDAVGVFVNGVRAELTIGSGNISIDNITDGGSNGGTPRNENLYLDNTGGQYNSEMDGLTVTLTLKAPVNPGVENTIWIGIADAGDASYDSNLLIAADSVQTEVIAYDDRAEMDRNAAQTLNVLGNDTSGLGTTLTITQINGQNVGPGDSVTLRSGTVVTLNPDGTLTFDSAGSAGTETITYKIDDGSGTTDVGFVTVEVTCFARGTLIDTARGPVPVEGLKVGDLLKTRDHGLQPLRWIGARRLAAAELEAAPALRPIRIRAGALGEGRPSSDLVVSPQHLILVRSRIAQKMFGTDEVLVAAKQLLALEGIEVAQDLAGVEYFHLLFDRHEVVLSNGAETESLYPGPQAMKSVGPAALAEIFAIFPELRDGGPLALPPARRLATGRQARRLALRHQQNNRALVC